MEDETRSELRSILGDPKKRKIARSGVRILQIIRDLMKIREEPTPRNITLEYYDTEVSKLSDTEKTSFIKKRRSVISRKLSDLQNILLIMAMNGTDRTDGRSIPYHLTLTGLELVNNEDIYLAVMEDRSDLDSILPTEKTEHDMEYRRKYHSNRIRTLLTKIKDEISRIFDIEFIPDNINPTMIRFRANNLPFRNDTLYQDLQNHIGTFLKFEMLEKKLDTLKTSVIRYLDLDEKIRRILISELSRELGMAHSGHHDFIDSFGPNLVDWVVRNLYYLHAEDNDLYMRYTSDLRSEKERVQIGTEKAKKIRIDGAAVMVLSINKKESYYLDKITSLMETICDTPVLEHYSEMVTEKERAMGIQNEIIHLLENEIEIPIYPGICPYILPDKIDLN
jgi:hypothetical protein